MTNRISASGKIVALGVFAFMNGLLALASTFSTTASADAFVTPGPTGALANNNYGGSGSFAVAPAGSPQGEFQVVMLYNLGPAFSAFNTEFGAGQWRIEGASLQLTATTAGNPIFNLPAAGSVGVSWMQNDAWVEGTGNPNTPSATGLNYNSLQSTFTSGAEANVGSFNFAGGTSGTTVNPLTLAPSFDADLTAGGSVSLRLFANDTTVSAIFNSRTFSTVASRPALLVQAVAVPEPTTISLLALGLLGLLRPFTRAQKR